MIRHGPAYDPTAEGIHDDGEEDKAGPRRNVGDIGNPETVKLGDIELPLDEVRSGARVGIAGGRSGAPAPVDALEGGLAHQSSDTLATHSDALLGESRSGCEAHRRCLETPCGWRGSSPRKPRPTEHGPNARLIPFDRRARLV